MYRSFVFACFLGVFLNQVYAVSRTEKFECLRKFVLREAKNMDKNLAKISRCEDLQRRVEEYYEHFEDCSVNGDILDPFISFVDELCEPGSKIFKDLKSGKECWPKAYPPYLWKCAYGLLSNLTEVEKLESCPSLKPFSNCIRNAAYKLCEEEPMKRMNLINRWNDMMSDPIMRLCKNILETV